MIREKEAIHDSNIHQSVALDRKITSTILVLMLTNVMSNNLVSVCNGIEMQTWPCSGGPVCEEEHCYITLMISLTVRKHQ